MPEFEIKANYCGGQRKGIFFGEKESVDYHCFSIKENIDDLPGEYFAPSSVLRTKNEKGWRNSWEKTIYCWLFISENLAQKFNLSFEKDKNYRFVIRLGEPKAAKFIATEIEKGYEYEEHQLVLKVPSYFKNTVKKIGFWGNDNYFYEVDKKEKSPSPKPNQPTPNQTSNQNTWVKVALICLPFLILALLLLLIKWISKKGSRS